MRAAFGRRGRASPARTNALRPHFHGNQPRRVGVLPVHPSAARPDRTMTMRSRNIGSLLAALCLLLPASALAAEADAAPSEFTFIVALAVLIVAGRVLGEVMQRVGQPAVMGQLL